MQTPSNEDIDSPLFHIRLNPPYHSDRVFDRGYDVDVVRGEFGYQRFPGGCEFALYFYRARVRRFDYARGEIYTRKDGRDSLWRGGRFLFLKSTHLL